MASSNGKLKGKPWSVWAEEMNQGSPSSDSEPGSSALPPTEDVMKLPREDMATYGQCPIWDRFILVTCHRCSRKVKVEALEAHVTLRHGSKSERNAYHKIKAAQAETALRACQISSTPMNRMLSFDEKKTYNPPDILVSGSSSSTSPLPVSYPSTPPNLTFRVSSPSPVPTPTPPLSATPSIQPADSASAPETRSPTPDHGTTELSGEAVEHMDIDLSHDIDNDVEMLPALPSSSSLPEKSVSNLSSSMAPSTIINYVGEEADSTTHNVISIPDSDDIPNIEIGIISEGQVMDSINIKYNVAILKTETSVDSTTSIPKIGLRPGPSLQSCAQPKPVSHLGVVRSEPRSPTVMTTPTVSTPPRISSHPARQFQFQHQDSMDIDNSPTQYITVSPLSKGSPKKPIIIKSGVEKKLTGREREYDPNKHCGVWDADAKRNCTRSLTCKSHSVYLKRKVTNRSAPFDELLAAHKAEKEAAAKLNESSSESEPTSILARRLQLAPGTPQKPWELSEPLKQSSLLKCSVAKRNYFPQTQQFKDNYCDENLHYTTDHPKPLAVCTFGGKRIGGLFIADRSKFLTRKVMKIAISNSGIQRIQPPFKSDQVGVKRVAGLISAPVTSRQQSMPYIVNLQGGAGVGRVGLSSSPRVGTLQIGTGGIQTQHFLVQDAFKTDIQDFKGGIKFELGRNIHILPSADSGGSG